MNDELEAKLQRKYPEYYGGDRPIQFACGDGWYSIIEEMTEEISKIDPQHLVAPLQIKEKFGRFNYYYSISGLPIDLDINKLSEKVDKIVKYYTKKANNTCELCGSQKEITCAAPKGGYWIRTMCSICREKSSKI